MATRKPRKAINIHIKSDAFNDFPQTETQFIRLFELIRVSAGHENAHAIQGLNNDTAIAGLKQNILDRLSSADKHNSKREDSPYIIGNDVLAMFQLMRYCGQHDVVFFSLVKSATARHNADFITITNQRLHDILIRGPHFEPNMLELYSEFGDRREACGDTAGWIDNYWRYTSLLIKRYDLDEAERILRNVLRRLRSDYKEHNLIKRMPTEGKQDKEGNIFRYLGKIYRLRGTSFNIAHCETERSHALFEMARRFIHIALELYKNIQPENPSHAPLRQVHGMANAYYELALIEAARGRYARDANQRFEDYLNLAIAHYEKSGDLHKIKICHQRRLLPNKVLDYDD